MIKIATSSGCNTVNVWPVIIYSITLAIGVGVFISSPGRSVAVHYENAANHWVQSESLYKHSIETGHGFLYLPHAAILYTPFALLNRCLGSGILGDILWRLVSWCVFVVGVWRLTRSACRQEHLIQWRVAVVVSLLGLSSLRIGQSTLPMGGLMMLSIEAWQHRRFSVATMWVGLAIAIKPLALVLALLLFALSRSMRVRMAIAAVVLAAFPFLTQSVHYVAQQYWDCYSMLITAAGLGDTHGWAQLFGMLNVFGVVVDPTIQKASRVVAALAVLGCMCFAVKKLTRERQVVWLLTFTMSYLMLFNPRTENSTYCLVGPVFGLFVAQLWAGEPTARICGRLLSVLLLVASFLAAGSYEIGKHFTHAGSKSIWLAPLCCCVLCVVVSFLFCVELGQGRELEEVDGAQDEGMA